MQYRKLYLEHNIIDMLPGSIPVARCSENISVCLEGMPVCPSYDPWEKNTLVVNADGVFPVSNIHPVFVPSTATQVMCL